MMKLYVEWREVCAELIEDGWKLSVDCGETRAREDFSEYAELGYVISFEDMLKLEKEYEGK